MFLVSWVSEKKSLLGLQKSDKNITRVFTWDGQNEFPVMHHYDICIKWTKTNDNNVDIENKVDPGL